MFIGLPATILSLFLAWMLSSDAKKLLADTGVLQIFATNIPIILGLVISCLSGLGAFLNFNDLAAKHRTTAENLNALWRDCKNFDTDFPDSSFCEKAVQVVQTYRKRLNDVNRDAPQIPKWAWRSVKKQRAEGSTSYRIDKIAQTPPAANSDGEK